MIREERLKGYKTFARSFISAVGAPKLPVDAFIEFATECGQKAVKKPCDEILREMTEDEVECFYLDAWTLITARAAMESFSENILSKSKDPTVLPLFAMIKAMEIFGGSLSALVLLEAEREMQESGKLALDETVCVVLKDRALCFSKGELVEPLKKIKMNMSSEEEVAKFMMDDILRDFESGKLEPKHKPA